MRLNAKAMAIALLSALMVFAAARADDDRDHDVARRAVERGAVSYTHLTLPTNREV